MKLRDAFRPYHDIKGHIWIVAYEVDDTIVTFNFSSWTMDKDHSCRITKSEYAELDHDSVIMYADGLIYTGAAITKLKEQGVSMFVAPISDTVLNKIVRGAMVSEMIPQKLQKFFVP